MNVQKPKRLKMRKKKKQTEPNQTKQDYLN